MNEENQNAETDQTVSGELNFKDERAARQAAMDIADEYEDARQKVAQLGARAAALRAYADSQGWKKPQKQLGRIGFAGRRAAAESGTTEGSGDHTGHRRNPEAGDAEIGSEVVTVGGSGTMPYEGAGNADGVEDAEQASPSAATSRKRAKAQSGVVEDGTEA